MYPAPPVTRMEDVTGPDCTVRAVIVAVVVTYSAGGDLLDRCLGALLATRALDRVVLVDTGRSVSDPADERIDLLHVDNRGYGAAANVGVEFAARYGADQIALLNDDVVVRSGWLAPLVEALDGDRVGAAQPKLLYADRDEPTINSLGVAVGPDGAGVDIGVGEPDDGSAVTAEIEGFTGGAVLLRREFLDATGGFDERYFLYYEDVDLAARGRALGWRYVCQPDSVVEHVGSATTGGDAHRTWYLQERNRLWCAFRNADAGTVGRAVWLSVRRLRHEPRRVNARAVSAGLAGAPVRVYERWRARRVSDRRA
jgi:N-acetylglucosaminyl-diphospho-decaprenol L-rhamnosyltransferase